MWNCIVLPVFCLILSVFYQFYFSQPISIVENPKSDYDYIIVGAGTAGCVIASRLSESSKVSVLLVEAGGYIKWLSTIPLAAPLLQGTEADWSYATESQIFSSRGLNNQKQLWPRGKGLGGSGQLNYLIHSFGVPEDYAEWPKGWSYEELLPYFKRVEDTMEVTEALVEKKLSKAFYDSRTEIEWKNTTFLIAKTTLKKGARWGSYHAYLREAWNRKNIHILINTFVTKVEFEKLTARSIEVKFPNGTMGKIKANKEIILCGGAVNTPQLLLLSGIGPVAELQKHHIPIVSYLENVGKNLYDHLNVPIYVNLQAPISVTLSKLKSLSEIFKYCIFSNGLLASNAIVGTARSGHSGIVLFGMGSADEILLKDVANFRTSIFRATFPSHASPKQEGFIYLASCLQPKSRGNVTLRSANFSDKPMIDPAYLENDYDIVCTRKAINLALSTLETKQFIDLGATVHVPNIKECISNWRQDYTNREYVDCLTRTIGLTSHHPGGTCKMGKISDSASVVDENLKVIGVNGLRIIDASVMPSPISGMPNSVIIAMAERAADILLANNKK